jgi:enamine deaminase RidA (YjgF/YER057c/UK114 family)
MSPEQRLAELGLALPQPPAAVGAYVPWIRTGNLVITSGQLPASSAWI